MEIVVDKLGVDEQKVVLDRLSSVDGDWEKFFHRTRRRFDRKTSPIPESLVLHVDQLSRNVNENHLKEIFGLQVAVTMFMCYLVGFSAFRALCSYNPAMI